MKSMLAIACCLLLIAAAALADGSQGGSGGPIPTPLTDAAGRAVSLAQPFTRIISLYGAHTENLLALGAGGVVIGVTRHDTEFPAAQGKAVFSYHDGLERFLAANPDLVLIRPMIDRGYAPLVKGLEKHGITVVSLQPGTVEEMMAYWRMLGALSGRQFQAEHMIAAFQQAVADFRALTALLRHRKRVYFEAIHNRMKTFTPGSMPIFALETAGGINIAADADQVRTTNIAYYGKERLLSRAAEIDVYLAQHGPMNQPTPALIRGEPGFEIIKAVRENQVFIIDEAIVARPTWRLLHGIEEIGSRLYPERFGTSGARILQAAEAARDAAVAAPYPNSSKAKVSYE
jgi:iron complex transport system substrate-binding protein